MFANYRRLVFTIFAIVYIMILPFLIIFSLGYDIDFKNQTITNALTLRIETVPRNAKIEILNTNLNTNSLFTPSEIRIADGKKIQLQLKFDNFKNEKFDIWSEKDQNNIVKIQNLRLLPENLTKSQTEKEKIISIISEKELLIKDKNKYYLDEYGFSGLTNKPIEIKTNTKKEILADTVNMFWDNQFFFSNQNLILLKIQNKWEILDFDETNIQIQNIVNYNDNNLLILDKNSNLWIFDINEKLLSFLDNGYYGLYFLDTPFSIWLLDSSQNIIKLTRNNKILEQTDLKTNKYLTFNQSLFLDNFVSKKEHFKDNLLKVKSLFLGNAFLVNNVLFYIQDSNINQKQIISNNVKDFGVSGSFVFWLDNNNYLSGYNLLIGYQKSFFTYKNYNDQDKITHLVYNEAWNRIFIYTLNKVIAVWYDKEIQNKNILTYYPVDWIEEANCNFLIIENHQFCVQDKNLLIYKNNYIPI